ncbi:MAG: hypothetical protein WCE75_10850 [Terracidiphilus sp.]
MTGNTEQLELAERLKLIETMIAEGRRTTESWGWTGVLWGVAYYIAIAWSTLGHSFLAWPVTMIAASLVTWYGAGRVSRNHPETTLGRSIGSVWIAMGLSIFIVLLSLALSGHYDERVFMAIIGGMLGLANAASSLMLRWRAQLGCAMVWWASAVLACFAPARVAEIAFLAAIFLGLILFGVYGMILEGRERRRREASHA